MTAAFDEAGLRHWLVEYLVTNIGYSPEDIELDASFNDLGLASRHSVVLSGELSELVGRPVSPVEFWEHPTINALARFLTGSEPDSQAEETGGRDGGSMDEPIAVIGLGCRFPADISGPESLWQFLCDGRSAVAEVPPDRWSPFDDGSPEVGALLSRTTRWGSFLSDIDGFDAEFFEIMPREAAKMDPQQRMLLEVAWEALEHAGTPPSSLRHSQTGVFVGACLGEYGYLASTDLPAVDAWSNTGGALSIIANRLSYSLDLRGPSLALDTACSSSLVAVHLACQSLRTGDSNLAIAAGVNLLMSPAVFRGFDQAGALSPTGGCHAFDASADGFVRGEGCGVAVLKRLSDALRDGDRVLAVVRGSAVNQDGRSNGLMAPNPAAQMAVLRSAYTNAGVPPHEVDYVEAHGTGTLLGDPIEARALGTVLGRARAESAPLLVGAVKSNLGHLEAAAGIAGFLKGVLAVQRGRIPANRDFHIPNPHIPFENLRLKVVAEATDWPSTGRPRRAGVSSFGFGGTNAHVVLEQAPDPNPIEEAPEPVVSTLVISGKTPARVASTAGVLAEWMAGEGAEVALADVAHTVNHHRTRYKHVAAVCARDRAQAVAGLRALAAGELAPGVVEPREGPRGSGTVFVYSGQGSQWAGMGRRLLSDEPAFAAAVAELEPAFLEHVGFSLRQLLADGEPVTGDARVQPVIMGLQLALTALWRSYGVHPDAVIGHSMGEVTAAVVAGALSPAEGLRVIATRSRLMSRLAGQGAVALLELDAEAATALIADYPGVSVTVYASPRQTVISGPVAPVDALIAEVAAQGRFARRVNMEVASHTALMDPILPELRSALADLIPKAPTIPFISTITDATTPTLDAQYWVANVRQPVRFSQAITTAARADHATFVEISPHPLLTYAIGDTLQSTSSTNRFIVTSALKRAEDETLFFHTQLAAVGVMAPNADGGRFADIPPSPWLHSRYWVASPSLAQRLPDSHPLLGVHVEMPSGRDHVWQADIGTEMMPSLADHKVHGQPVMSAASFAEMALAAGCEALGLPVEAVRVNELEVKQTLALDRRTRVTTQIAQSDDGIRVEIHASSGGGNWCRYAVASIAVTHGEGPAKRPAPPVEAGSGGLATEIVLPDEAADHPRYCIHPLMLDAALQSLVGAMPAELLKDDPTETAYLPASLATIRVFGHVGRRARCHTELVSPEQEGAYHLGRIVLMDDMGTPTAELTGVELRRIDPGTVWLPLEQKIFDTAWVESSIRSEVGQEISAAPAGSWLLLADGDAETKALVAEFAARLSSPTRQVISEEFSDESAVLEAVAKTAADPELPAVGMIVFVGKRSFDGTDPDGAFRRACELIWAISVAARAAADGRHGKSPRLWLITRNGLAVHGDEPGDPAIGALKGLIRTWRFPGEAARVLGNEPDVGATLVDLESAGDVVATLMRELDSPARDDVIAWREERRYVERLSRATLDAGGGDAAVRIDGSYIVTGGLGGLGIVVTRWLVQRGAGRLVLNGRTEPSESQQSELAELARSAEVVFVPGDIASPGVAERLVAVAEETGRSLRGVVHAAGVIADGQVAAHARHELERVWAPKVAGALSLHAATATRPLDWWVGFSSVASLMGLPGQMVYASANAWLDALAAWRRASGLPATTINWGQWSEVGLSRSLTYSSVDPITPAEGIEALESLVGSNLTRVGVARLRLDRALATTPEFRELGYFDKLVGEFDTITTDNRSIVGDGDRSVASAPDWSQIPAENRARELEIRLKAILARELRMPPSAVGMDRPFPELGLDSMMAMTILREARQFVGIDMSATMLWNHPTVSSLAACLAEMLPLHHVPVDDADPTFDSASSVLDELFDSVESATAGSESGNFR